jgi:alpha-ribazole phosphatase
MTMAADLGAASRGAAGWWWVRHAPVLNPDGIVTGRFDLPADLSDRAALAAAAALLPSGAVWLSSPLARARDTAVALLALKGEAGRIDCEPAFVEQDLGEWQGRPAAAHWAAMPADHPYWRAPAATAPPGGESFAAVMARVAAGIERRNGRHEGCPIVVVAHAGPVRAAVARHRGLSPEEALALAVPELSVHALRMADGADGHRNDKVLSSDSS